MTGCSSQQSKFAYVPQPYFAEGGSDSCIITPTSPFNSSENAEGIFTPDLSDFFTAWPVAGAAAFDVTFEKEDARFADLKSGTGSMVVALLGCSVVSYADDGGGSPDLTTGIVEPIEYSITPDNVAVDEAQYRGFAHNSGNDVHTFCRTPLRGIISGGTANLIASGFGPPNLNDGLGLVNCIVGPAVTSQPHIKVTVGHIFVGIEIPVTINPDSFSWGMRVSNQRHKSRDQGAKPSSGTIIRESSGEILKADFYDFAGAGVISAPGANINDVFIQPNFFDALKANTSYPILFNPYPISTQLTENLTPEMYGLIARQNFFSIYGFLDGAMQLQSDHFRDGINSKYRMKFSIEETR